MAKAIAFLGIIVLIIVGCGPDTIFVRPELDTPALHVSNGNRFLEQDKWEDARREFERAKYLDPYCTEAYIGLAIGYGRNGNPEKGFKLLEDARRLAAGDDELRQIQIANEKLRQMSGSP